MKLLTKIASVAFGAVAALGMSMAANAAVTVTDLNSTLILDETNPIFIRNLEVVTGDFSDDVDDAFSTGDFIELGAGSVDVTFSSGVPSGIANMFITFSVAGLPDQVFQVTDAAGRQILDFFTLDLEPNALVSFEIKGTVFEALGSDAAYSLVVTATPVPLPAAGVFLLTGLAGAAGLRLRKKAAA